MEAEKIIIGRKEKANFPNLHLENIPVKIDTGAYTSSIHCYKVEEENDKLKCYILDPEHPKFNCEPVYFNTYTKKKVTSSNGITENRYRIKSTIEILGNTYKIDLTLTNRSNMKYPVLIGRKFLKKRFIVDVSV